MICNPLLFAYNFNWHSNCLQFTINLLFAALQLQLALKIACNLQSVALCLQLHLAFKLPAIHNQFALCSSTTSTGIQIACNLQSVALAYNFNWHTNCLQFALRCSLPTTSNVIQRPAICNLFAPCLQLLLAYKCPQFATCLLFACNYY